MIYKLQKGKIVQAIGKAVKELYTAPKTVSKRGDAAYNAALKSGDTAELQRLRDAHFVFKAPNAPQYDFYHGTFNKEKPFYIFEPQSNNELFFHFSPYKDTAEKFMGINKNGRLITAKLNIQKPMTVIDSGGGNGYRIPEANPRIAKQLEMNGPDAGQYYSDLLLTEPSVSEANGKMMDKLGYDAFMYKNYTEDSGRISIAVPRSTHIKLADPITYDDNGQIIPLSKRDDFTNPDIRYGFNLDEVPKADYKYNPKTGDFEVNPPIKEWIDLSEDMTTDYFVSPEYYRHLLRSGADPDLARDISEIRWFNALNRRPSLFRNLGPNIYGTAENKNGFPLIRYNNRKNVGASLYDFNTVANTAFHELGGHGSSLNYGSGTIIIPDGEHLTLKAINDHNAQLKPKLRPFYQAIYDGNIEEARRLALELDDVYKTGNGEKNIKKIKENIDYMLDNQEYSARGIGSNISDHYGLKNGWNETQLRKYFTDESVDNLKRNVGGLVPFIGLGLSQIPSNKKGGIIKAQRGLKAIIENRFPIMKSYNYHIYPDKEVSKGYGDIETFAGNGAKDVIHYNNGFNLSNRYPGETSIVFNPDKVTDEDIALDALHIAREQDPVYQDFLKVYEDEAKKTNYEDFKKDGTEEDFHNGIDGVLRGSMYQGDRIKAKYAPKEEYDGLYKTYPKLGEAFKNIKTYLESGYITPSIISVEK